MIDDIGTVARDVRERACPLAGPDDVGRLADEIGDARFALLGEASHGTDEFYRLRAALTRRLIEERGFDAVAVEADWPAALRASRHAQGLGDDASTAASLGGFERFPRWMWRNAAVLEWLDWLRGHNAGIADPARRIGFYGLDLYSLRGSMDAVLRYLDRADPPAAACARARYGCFDGLADDPQAYGQAVHFDLRDDCARAVLQQLDELARDAARRLRADRTDRGAAGDELFYAEQNARVVRNAEAYYRTMFGGRVESWNLRDRHMAETLARLDEHLSAKRGRPARIVVWAHNSHLGDARATEWFDEGQLNLGQLVREAHPDPAETFLVGFTTHAGTVAAAADWDAPVECKRVLPSREDSIERVLHESCAGRDGIERFVLPLRGLPEPLARHLAEPRLQRAIGVIYRPDTERWSHYFPASLARQFDAVVHVDTTRAVVPLDASERPWRHTAEPETFPSGV